MKTLIKIILFSFLLSSVSTYSQSGICDNFGKEKALYVGGFFEGYNNNPLKETQSNYHEQILGNKHKEQALIDYAIRNKISHLYLYGLDKLFINGKGSENYLGFYGLLKDFIVECNSPSLDPSKKIKVSFAFSPGITENYHRHSLVTPTKDRVIENFEADTFFSTWPLIKGLITEGTETDFSINTMLYIYGSVKHLNRLFEKSTSEFAQLGVHAITVEHEWWHAKDLAPEDMAVYIKARLDTHLTYLSILAEMREEEVIQEVHEYLGEISDNISTTNRNIHC